MTEFLTGDWLTFGTVIGEYPLIIPGVPGAPKCCGMGRIMWEGVWRPPGVVTSPLPGVVLPDDAAAADPGFRGMVL